jgi:hypothetical protein
VKSTPKFFSPRQAKNPTEPRMRTRDAAFAEKIDAVGRNPVKHAQFFQSEIVQQEPEDRAGEKQRRKHRGDDAESQGDGETLDRAGGLPEKNGRGDQGGHVGVKDGGEGLVVGRIDRGPERFARRHFLAEALVNEDVGVNGHADGQDDAGDTGQGEDKIEHAHRPEEEDEIDCQGQTGDEAGQPVISENEKEGEGQAEETGADAATDGVRSE